MTANLHPTMEQALRPFLRFDPAAELVGNLAPAEKALLAMEEQKHPHQPVTAKVIPIAFVSQAERDRLQIDAERKDFIERRTDELLKERDSFGALLMELIAEEALADMAVVALRDAYEEQGKCWDGISAFGDLIHARARIKAAALWRDELEKLKPLCCSCHHSAYDRGNETSESGHYCKLDFCLWSE